MSGEPVDSGYVCKDSGPVDSGVAAMAVMISFRNACVSFDSGSTYGDRSNAEAMNDSTGKQKLLQQLVHRLKQGDAQTKTFDAPLPNSEFVQLQCMPFEDES